MAAAVYDIAIEQGSTFNLTITWRDTADALVNLTGYTARMQIRATTKSPTVLLELLTSNGRITLGGAAGTIALTITAADTATLGDGTAVYDLELVAAGGEPVRRLLKGAVTIDAEVTR